MTMCFSSVVVLLDAIARLNQALEHRPAEEERRGYEGKEPSPDHIALTQVNAAGWYHMVASATVVRGRARFGQLRQATRSPRRHIRFSPVRLYSRCRSAISLKPPTPADTPP